MEPLRERGESRLAMLAENTPLTTCGPTRARNALVGNHFYGNPSITFHNEKPGFPHSDRPKVCHSIPFEPNKDLVYRTEISCRLERLLPPSSDYHSAALWGLGGSGKTQLALAYAHSRWRADSTCSVFWIHADNETSFTQDYQLIAWKLGLSKDLDGQDLLHAVRQQIEVNPNWVLVLDNADNLALFGLGKTATCPDAAHGSAPTPNLREFVPRGMTGTVLWTSRDGQVSSLVARQHAIHITQMTPDEARQLLLAGNNEGEAEQDNKDVQALLTELEWFPLAISQAAAYMQRTSTPTKDYLSEIQSRKRRSMLEKSEHDRYRRRVISNSILQTWDISIEYLSREDQMAYDILHTLAYLDNQHISVGLIREIARSGKRIIDPPASLLHVNTQHKIPDDEGILKESITRLRQFSFLAVRASNTDSQQQVYEVHKLVQEAARHRLRKRGSSEAERVFAKTAFLVIDSLFPNSQHDTWQVCEEHVKHAQQTGEWAALHDGEAIVAALLARVSKYLTDKGRWREKELTDNTTLRLRRLAFGDRHADTIASMASVATAYLKQGRFDEAEKLSEEVLNLRREILGDNHLDTVESMVALASAYHQQGRYPGAEKIHEKAWQLRGEILGREHPDTMRSFADVAEMYGERGKYNQAEEIVGEILPLQQNILGERHENTIWSMALLANIYYAQGRYVEGEEMSMIVWKLRQKILGDKHPDTIFSKSRLATMYQAQGMYDKAEENYEKVLELRKEVLGEKHPDTIESLASLASTYHQQRRDAEAEKIKLQVRKLRNEVLGEKHPETIRSMTELASTYHAQGRYNEAEKDYKKALQLRVEILGENHPDTFQTLASLASTYHMQQRYDEAEEISMKVMKLRVQVLGESHPDTISSMAELASTYYDQQKYDQSERDYEKVLKLREEILGNKHPDTIETLASLALACYMQEKYDEAEKNFTIAMKLRKEVLGERHPDTIRIMAELASTCYKQRKYTKAENIKTKVLTQLREELGENHPATVEIWAALEVMNQTQGKQQSGWRRVTNGERSWATNIRTRWAALGKR